MKPQVVLKEEDTNTGSQKNIGSEEVRQIVSSETSKELRDMLRSVVATGTGRNAEVNGFNVGGKSGTSEPDYSDKSAEYIASFNVEIGIVSSLLSIILLMLFLSFIRSLIYTS